MAFEIGNSFVNKLVADCSPHLHIIISFPFGVPEKVVMVNVSSWRDKAETLNDPACILNVGDHKFIKRKSYIYYHKARCVKTEYIQKAIGMSLLIPDDACSDVLLEKILIGAGNSKKSPNGISQILRQQQLI